MTPLRAVIWCAVSTKAQTEEDKDSLPSQERDARNLCERNGWTIVDVLRVPGHSRRYVDIYKCAADMRSQGIDAFDRLLELWDTQVFDVLIVRDGDRFARTQSLHAYVVETTINEMRGRIYSMADGWIDEKNYRMFTAMSGYRAAGAVDALVQARDRAMDNAAQRGLPTSAVPIMSHHIIYGKGHKRERLEVNESKRRLWDDLATLILEGVAWDNIEDELYKRYGHINPDTGRRYGSRTMYKVVYNPYFWGHSGRHYNDPDFRFQGKRLVGPWLFDEHEPAPPHMELYYNTHQPVWTGELAERIKAELRRRNETLRGQARPYRTYRFTGLLICASCGYHLVCRRQRWVRKDGTRHTSWQCTTPFGASNVRPFCGQRKWIRDEQVFEYVNQLLVQLVLEGKDAFASSQSPEEDRRQRRVEQFQQEIAKLETKIDKLINDQLEADTAIRHIYQQRIERETEQLKILRQNLIDLQRITESPSVAAARQRTIEEIAAMGIDRFWEQESVRINQMLHRLFAKRRLVVLDGQIIGFGTAKQGPSSR